MTDSDVQELDGRRRITHLSIPIEFIDDPRYQFSPLELLLIANIDSFSYPPLYCFASNEYFAKKFNVTVTTISTAINRLIKLGFVKKVSFNGRQRVIKCTISTTFSSLRKRNQTLKNLKS